MTVGFAGLTHSGIVAALTAAARGARVVAFDSDMALVARLKRGDLPVVAPALIQRAMRSQFDYTATAADLSQCDVIYICPDVPTSEKGRSDLAMVKAVLDDAAAARPDAVLVILSPVPPGFSRAQLRKGRALYYQLEPLVLDQALEGVADPACVVIGCADPAAPLPAALQRFLDAFGCPILPMRYESAELARFSLSLLRIAGASATASLVDLCAKSGADWSEMARALEQDRHTATPVGVVPGFAVERDLARLRRLAESQSADATLIEKVLADIRERRNWVLQRLEEEVLVKLPDARLAILGLASQQGTTSTEDSPALALLASLPKLRIRAYDPAVVADPAWHAQLETASDALDACHQADAVVIMTPWPEFTSLDPAALTACMRGRVLIDPYRVLDPGAVKQAGLAHLVPA